MEYIPRSFVVYPQYSFPMKTLPAILLACAGVLVYAAGPETGSGPVQDKATAPASAPSPSSGVMPAGPLFSPLTSEEGAGDSVSVPEPVWASVLAACVLSFLRRGRH